MLEKELTNPILAMLFVATDPLTLLELQEVYPKTPPEELRNTLDDLVAHFNSFQAAIEIRQISGGYRMTTRPEHHEDIRSYLQTKPSAKLSLAALETLAVIAYKQPITGAEVAEIRGVNTSGVVGTLLERQLVKVVGRKRVVGRPFLYATTPEFLDCFGLSALDDLPKVEEMAEALGMKVPAGLAAPTPVTEPLPFDGEPVAGEGAKASEPESVH